MSATVSISANNNIGDAVHTTMFIECVLSWDTTNTHPVLFLSKKTVPTAPRRIVTVH